MVNIIEFFFDILNNYLFLFTIECCSFIFKAFLLIMVILRGLASSKIRRPWFFLLLVLIGAMFSDLSWICSILHKSIVPTIDYRPILFLLRLAWALNVVQYQALSLFIESLIDTKNTIRPYQKIFITISSIFCFIFLYLAVFQFHEAYNRPSFEFDLLKISSLYVFAIITPSLLLALKTIRSWHLPKILKKQLKILLQILIAPYLILDFIQVYPFSFFPSVISSNFAVVSISTTLLTFAFYFAAKKMMGLRFLNFQNQVQSPHKFNFIDDFKDVLEQLSYVTSIKELGHITQSFFKAAFRIQPNRVMLYVRKLESYKVPTDDLRPPLSLETAVEAFINRHSTSTCHIAHLLRQHKILITDEIAFSNFYDESTQSKELLSFLEHINADIFIPIFEKQIIIGYIIVERDARINEFYSNIEHDEMVVFASYLSNIINLLQNRNLESLMHHEKEMQEELYRKHQEINQYKESIRSFLTTQHRKIGILFYKNRQFVYGNQAAQELIATNPNQEEGDTITKVLKHLAQQVLEFKTSKATTTRDSQGNKLVISALPSLEHNHVIFTIYHPEINDIIKTHLDQVKNPSEWDYLLYLETTNSGMLINQLIPGSGPHLLNFKIELLKMAFSKKALLLDMPEEDLQPTVEILHHISIRQNLHIITLQAPEKHQEIAIKLFGINPILAMNQEQSLLEKLNGTGTLFIKNIHFLDLETQNYLAEFIRYGIYHIFKSDQKMVSNVRIICSTHQDLTALVHAGKFSKALFNELKETTLVMPSLITLPNQELTTLIEGFTEQAIKGQTFKNLLALSDKEKDKLLNARPISLQEFKVKIQHLLVNKSKKNNIAQEIQIDPSYHISDPELAQAARLGKKALKDRKIMALLWQRFENQNKIATFLGVNRSSVNRRCKEYNLC